MEEDDYKRVKTLEDRLFCIKELDLDRLVFACLKKLGLKHGTNENQENKESEHNRIILDLMMQHKKIIALLKQLSDKVMKFRERKLWVETEEEGNQRKQKVLEYSTASGVFIDSLSGRGAMSGAGVGEIQRDEYGYDINDEYTQISKPAKKNRKGQRARLAKALALEAKRDGKVYKSINWRPKKAVDEVVDENVNASGLHAKNQVKAEDVAEMGKDWKDEGKAHPSWAAKEHAKKQSGIAAFAGKKIVFD